MIGFILSPIITGLIVGALGRLAVPGPNPMSIGMTLLIGIGGALIGAIVAGLLGAGPFIQIILEVLASAGIIYFMQKRNAGRTA